MPKMKIEVHEAQDWKQAFDKAQAESIANCEKLLNLIKNYQATNRGAWGCVGSMNAINNHIQEVLDSFPKMMGTNHT